MKPLTPIREAVAYLWGQRRAVTVIVLTLGLVGAVAQLLPFGPLNQLAYLITAIAVTPSITVLATMSERTSVRSAFTSARSQLGRTFGWSAAMAATLAVAAAVGAYLIAVLSQAGDLTVALGAYIALLLFTMVVTYIGTMTVTAAANGLPQPFRTARIALAHWRPLLTVTVVFVLAWFIQTVAALPFLAALAFTAQTINPLILLTMAFITFTVMASALVLVVSTQTRILAAER